MDNQDSAPTVIMKLQNGFVLVSIQESDLRKILQRALNTWADAPKHLVTLADELGD